MKSVLIYICWGALFVVAFAYTTMAQDGLKRLPKQFDMPFQATTLEDARKWQDEARKKLFGYVEAFCPRKSVEELPLDVKIESTEERDTYTKYRISYGGNEGERKTAILTVPKGTGPFPAILALHGHGGNEDAVFNDPQKLYRAFADDFAQGGYVVLAPSLEHRKYAGMQLWNLIRLVDILESHPAVDKERIGVAGLSMGGEWTMWVAACDLRLKAAVVSGWMCTTKGCLSVPNCECWEMPGFFTLMDVAEINLLLAPRPVVFESSLKDECFPINYCRDGFARIREGYGVFGAKDAVSQDTWNAGHEWHGELAYPMMDGVLKGNATAVYQGKSPTETNPQIPENFPRFIVKDNEDTGKAMRDLFWYHYPGAGPMSTFEDGWLVTPSLWPDTDKGQANRERWKNAFLARKIDATGYVETLQHDGYAHRDGWPFPLYSQGGAGWVFSHIHGAFYNEDYGVHLTKSLDNFALKGISAKGITEKEGLQLQVTDSIAVFTTPVCDINAETIALLRFDWDILEARPTIYLDWTADSEPEYSAGHRVTVPLPAEGEFYTHLFINKVSGWKGKITCMRLTFENARNAKINLRSWIATFDSRHVINQSCFIKGCYDYLQWTGDIDFLQKNMNRMRTALAYAISEFEMEKYHCVKVPWTGHDGRSGISYDPQTGKATPLVGIGIGGNYWDILPFGGKDCLGSIYYYDALLKMASLEEAILQHPEWAIAKTVTVRSPEWLRSLAQKLKDANTMFWNARTGRFVASVDIDNVSWDYGFTFVNNEAIYYGYANDEQAKSILSWLNGDRIVDGDTSQGADIYHWRFGPRSTTKRNLEYYIWGWSGAATIPFGDQVQDGGAVLGFAFHDLMARIRYLGPDNAEKYLSETVRWFREVQDEGGYRKYYAPEKKRGNMQGGNVAGGLGLDLEFFESVLYPQVMLFGFMGFNPEMEGFSIYPKLPVNWPELTIDRIRWQDQTLTINASKNTITVSFAGPERAVSIHLPAGQWKLISAQGSEKTVTSPMTLTTKSGETVKFEHLQ